MIVVDAWAITELLLQTALGSRIERRIYGDDSASTVYIVECIYSANLA